MARQAASAARPPDAEGGGELQGIAATVIETRSLADEIAFRLEAAILARELMPGTKLRQEELCQRFGWTLTLGSDGSRGTRAQIELGSSVVAARPAKDGHGSGLSSS